MPLVHSWEKEGIPPPLVEVLVHPCPFLVERRKRAIIALPAEAHWVVGLTNNGHRKLVGTISVRTKNEVTRSMFRMVFVVLLTLVDYSE